MQEKLEKLIKLIYKKWKSDMAKTQDPHPDEEDLACFFEGRIPAEQAESIKAHLVKCRVCSEAFAVRAAADSRLSQAGAAPDELIERAKKIVGIDADKPALLEIFLRFKEKAIEILNTTGDVLVGRELVPAPVLRSRKISDFKDEVIIFKDFKAIRVELKIENKGASFILTVMAKEQQAQKIIKDLRVSLIKDDLELESYLSDSGKVAFENVLLGKYAVEISSIENKLASILLDIKI